MAGTQLPITDLDIATPKLTDVYPAVDTTDTTQSPDGSTYKYAISALKTLILSGFNAVVTATDDTTVIANQTTYFCVNDSSVVTLTTAAAPVNGDRFTVVGVGAAGWGILLGSVSQIIRVGTVACTAGSGSISSTNRYDAASFVYRQADNTWYVTAAPQGTLNFDAL